MVPRASQLRKRGVGGTAQERGLVETARADGLEAAGVLDERTAMGDQDVVDHVPVTTELACDLVDRPTRRPTSSVARRTALRVSFFGSVSRWVGSLRGGGIRSRWQRQLTSQGQSKTVAVVSRFGPSRVPHALQTTECMAKCRIVRLTAMTPVSARFLKSHHHRPEPRLQVGSPSFGLFVGDCRRS